MSESDRAIAGFAGIATLNIAVYGLTYNYGWHDAMSSYLACVVANLVVCATVAVRALVGPSTYEGGE